VCGIHQAQNLAVAIAAVEAFLGGGEISLADDVLRSAVSDVSSPGRLQLVKTEPPLLLDGAHNPAGALTLADALKSEFSKKPLVGLIAVLAEKDAEGVLSNLAGVFHSAVITESSSPRSMPVSELEPMAKGLLSCHTTGFSDFYAGLERAKEIASQIDGMVVVTGSITLVGDVIKMIQEESDAE
jgi:dihydrofolate synthase/folylpolyglutamate synthase